ncbi:MAG: helix-turn-helix domain-containing protein [Actinomycetota bacterium]|nr:helix-turn-helix domain-containing protein [Actinomycetota bacterium]
MTTTTVDRLLTTNEAASLTGFSEKTHRNWRCAGTGPPYVRVGRAVRYRESELRRWVESLH